MRLISACCGAGGGAFLPSLFAGHLLRVYHCTRLLPHEVTSIQNARAAASLERASFFLISGFFAPREGAPVNARVHVQARKRGPEAANHHYARADAPSTRPAGDRERVPDGNGLLRELLSHLPRPCRDHRRRASGSAQVGPTARRQSVAASGPRRRARIAGDAPLRALPDACGRGTDPVLCRPAGCDAARGGAGRRKPEVRPLSQLVTQLRAIGGRFADARVWIPMNIG